MLITRNPEVKPRAKRLSIFQFCCENSRHSFTTLEKRMDQIQRVTECLVDEKRSTVATLKATDMCARDFCHFAWKSGLHGLFVEYAKRKTSIKNEDVHDESTDKLLAAFISADTWETLEEAFTNKATTAKAAYVIAYFETLVRDIAATLPEDEVAKHQVKLRNLFNAKVDTVMAAVEMTYKEKLMKTPPSWALVETTINGLKYPTE